MRIGYYFSGFGLGRLGRLVGLTACGLLATGHVTARGPAQHASGGGTYLVMPGVRSEFQFDQARVQCKIGHTVLDDGTVFQMFMFSTSVESVTIDSGAKTVTITGSMVSIVNLRFTDGTADELLSQFRKAHLTPQTDTPLVSQWEPTLARLPTCRSSGRARRSAVP